MEKCKTLILCYLDKTPTISSNAFCPNGTFYYVDWCNTIVCSFKDYDKVIILYEKLLERMKTPLWKALHGEKLKKNSETSK